MKGTFLVDKQFEISSKEQKTSDDLCVVRAISHIFVHIRIFVFPTTVYFVINLSFTFFHTQGKS